ncbi:MAG: YIP1 family protein [bacterium]|nr:YIP1 family protein [bacterium]
MVNLLNNYKVQEGLNQTVSQISLEVLTSPKEAIKKIIYRGRKTLSISILLIASLSIALSFFLLLSHLCPIRPLPLIFGCLLELSKIILGLFIASAFIHITAGFLSANGQAKPLFFGLFLSLLPFSFLLPLTILSFGTTPVLGFFIFPLLVVWSNYLLCLVVQEVYQVSLTKAVSILVLPGLIFYIAGLLMLFFGIGAIIVYSL